MKFLDKEDKPREKLLKYGAKNLTDKELIAIFLRTGTKQMPVLKLAQHCLDKFGSLAAVLQASLQEFTTIHGLGSAKYVQLQAIMEMAKRSLVGQMQEKIHFNNSTKVQEFLSMELQNQEREVFAVMFLNNAHQLLHFEILFYGTINQTQVHPREIVKSVIYHNASSIIVAHNHPSGNLQPSKIDIEITKKIKSALECIDVQLLDHVIIGKNKQSYSFSENLLLADL